MKHSAWPVAFSAALVLLASCGDEQALPPQAPSADVSKPEDKTTPSGTADPGPSIVPGTKTETPGTTTEVITPPPEVERGGEAPLVLKHPCVDNPSLCSPLRKAPETAPLNPAEVKDTGVKRLQ